MASLGDKYAGKPNKYLTGSIEKAKMIIKQYEANLKACPSACDMSTAALEARLLGKGDWTKNNSLIFDHANDCGGGCRPSCQLNACPNEGKGKGLSHRDNKIGCGVHAHGCPTSMTGDKIIASCGGGCSAQTENETHHEEDEVASMAQMLGEAMGHSDHNDALF